LRPTSYDPPSTPLPTYKEPEPFADAPRSDPFNQPMYTQPLEQNQPLQPAEWTPPPAPEAKLAKSVNRREYAVSAAGSGNRTE
jgi:hypothetical protein